MPFKNLQGEIWRNIKDIPKIYKVSNKGRVYSEYIRNIKKQHIDITGYFKVGLTIKIDDKKHSKTPKVHILVAKAFIPNPNNYKVVNHKDGNKLNNNAENLEWCTYSQNTKHAYKNNLMNVRKRMVKQSDLQENVIKIHDSMTSASNETNITLQSIWFACQETGRTAGGFKWEYDDKNDVKITSLKNESDKIEIWIELEGYPNYWISTRGSLYNSKTKKIKEKHINGGYYNVNIKRRAIRLHRLIALSFISNPYNHKVVNHKDGNKLNNNIENLEWCSQKQNTTHSYKMGLSIPKGRKAVNQYSLSGTFIRRFCSMTDASKNAGCSTSLISMCCSGKKQSAYGFKWSYA